MTISTEMLRKAEGLIAADSLTAYKQANPATILTANATPSPTRSRNAARILLLLSLLMMLSKWPQSCFIASMQPISRSKQMPSTEPLWRALAQTLDLSPDEAQAMARRLRAHGIETWEQWLAAGEVVA